MTLTTLLTTLAASLSCTGGAGPGSVSGARAPRPAPAPAAAVNALADEYLAVTDSLNRGGASMPGWFDRSPAAVAALARREDAWLARIRGIAADRLVGGPAWVTAGMLREAVESSVALRVCRLELWDVDQLGGWHLYVPQAAATLDVGTAGARRRALAQFRALDAKVAQEIANLRAGVASGYTAPKVNVRRVIEQVETMLPADVRASPLYSPALRDSSAPPSFAAEWAAVLREHAYPAMTRYRDYLAGEYLAAAREESGLGALPAGAACYRAMVRANTSVDVAPEELERVGAAERAAVDSQLRPLLDSLAGGRRGVDAKRYLRTAPELRFASRDEMLAHARANLERARAAMPRLFVRVPTAPLVVEPTPAYRERSDAPARYQPPDTTGRPGVFVLNTYQPETRPRLDDGIGAFHEGLPGHHFQASYAAERKSAHPVTQRIGTGAFVEGWAFYAERLAAEVGLYSGPLQRAGYLLHQIDGWTALQVDPGLHVGAWSRRQAIDTIVAATGKSEDVAASYADRHAATPGQLVSYMVGYRWIARLRADAERALGDRFDLRAFHDVVLADGPVTLPMLEAKVRRWIAEQQAAASRASSPRERAAKDGH